MRLGRGIAIAPLALVVLAAGCGGGRKAQPTAEPVAVTPVGEQVPGPVLSPRAVVPLVSADQLVDGYRVQLFQSTQLRDCEQFRDAAAVRLDKPVYVEYLSPLYRVRAGDFLTREAADAWRDGLAAQGFERAETVSSRVRSGGG
ncbi:MAG TPA: SPOR domain-containing protein [Candidatus Eisenbacteria bacterium]